MRKIVGSFLTISFLVLLTLKLAKVIAWSWWWVFSPLWIPIALAIWAAIIIFVVFGVTHKNIKVYSNQ